MLLVLGYIWLPARYNPLTPLSVTDTPNIITQYKLSVLAARPEACFSLLFEAQRQGYLQFHRQPDTTGRCALHNVVRVTRFGPVHLSSSFLASCPLALRSAMFIRQQAIPLSEQIMKSPLVLIEHLGSYACRNIYHRANARLSDHASADAIDINGFRLADGQHIRVLQNWGHNNQQGTLLDAFFRQSCRYYGSAIGPAYNAAHANHFHLSSRGFGFCH